MAFIQQKASTSRVNPTQDDEQVLEALVGFDTVSQSTLLLKKKKEMQKIKDPPADYPRTNAQGLQMQPAVWGLLKFAVQLRV